MKGAGKEGQGEEGKGRGKKGKKKPIEKLVLRALGKTLLILSNPAAQAGSRS